MEGDTTLRALLSLFLLFANAFFVAGEYALVGCRRTRIEALVRQGNRTASLLRAAFDNFAIYVAGVQVAIAMCSIGIGMVTEPLITEWLKPAFGAFVPVVSVGISLLLVTFALVVLGELVPKYVAIHSPERLGLILIRPLRFCVTLLHPIAWLAQRSGALVILPFGIKISDFGSESVSKEDLMLLVRSGTEGGSLEEEHAQVISKALRLDVLDANDIMIHRIDIQWLDIATPFDQMVERVAKISHNRIPVCRGDIDDMAGVLYLQDFVRHWGQPDFDLERIIRPVEAVPENLPLNRVINRMRDAKTQILIVMDEYGGTSGLITLEDVVEEVFGELEDQLESERPPIEMHGARRVSARADVRYDELMDFLGLENDGSHSTDTLAQIMTNLLERVPKLGDFVELPIGIMRVENMARRRITRVSIQLARDVASNDS